MRAPRIEMAQLIPLSGKDGQQGDPFVVPFNPATLKVTYSNSISQESGTSATQVSGKQTADLAVELLFDTTDTSFAAIDWGDDTAKGRVRPGADIDVRIFTARIVALMQPDKGASNQKDQSAPPRVRFVWGSFLFNGVLKSLTESLELFSAQGIPLRASLSLSLSEDKLDFTQGPQGDGGGASLFTPLAGVNAAGAMASLGLDPLAGKLMAAVNGLDDLRTLPAGVALSVPGASLGGSVRAPLGAAASASFGLSVSGGAPGAAGAGISAAAAGGFGGGGGVSVTLGGGGNFGLDAGARSGAGVGVGASAGLSLGVGISGSLGFGASLGIGVSAGLNIGVTGAISGGPSGGSQTAVALPGSGAVGGPRNGAAPGAQVVMDPGGRMALAPAAPLAPISPPSTAPAVTTDRTRTAPPAPRAAAGGGAATGTRISGAVGVAARGIPTSAGLPPPLPPQSSGAARGAFEGIHGVPLKRPRFSVGVPPLRPLAYRRFVEDGPGLDPQDPCSSGSVTGAASSTGGSCGCAGCKGNKTTPTQGARCACQH